MKIEVRDESADLMGHLDVAEVPDQRCKNIIIPCLQDGMIYQLILSVERVRVGDTHWVALRANSHDIDTLNRCQKFTPL